MRIVVVDTNVVVSGLLTSDGGAPTARILDGMLEGTFAFLLSPPLLAEYREVLLRPTIRGLHGLEEGEVDAILTEIAANGILREPAPTTVKGPDPDDDHLWALCATRPDSVLVTGDRRLLERPPDQASVITPRAFVELVDRGAE